MGLISRLLGRPDTVLHYTGHRILSNRKASRFPAKREADIAKILSRLVKKERVRAGYGGLASGSDILFAEALLAAGAELHIVLACDKGRYIASSVAEAGPKWVARFHDVLAQAASVTLSASADETEIDFGAATRLALDLGEAEAARGRSWSRSGKLQIAIFDGHKNADDAGTGADIDRAAGRGWRQIIVNPAARGRIKPRYLSRASLKTG